jgi:hypothetical protein
VYNVVKKKRLNADIYDTCKVVPAYREIFVAVDFFTTTLTIRLIQKKYCKYVNGYVKLKVPTIVKHVAMKIYEICIIF